MANVYRFVITAENETAVHGRRNRTEIAGYANKVSLRGQVKNTKGRAEIEVFCVKEDKQAVMQFIQELQDKEKQKSEWFVGLKFPQKEDEINLMEYPKAENFMDFLLVREDELTEMVWALQGAGYEFIKSTKKLDKIATRLEKRDIERRNARLASLTMEITKLRHEIRNLRGKKEIPKFGLISLEQNIRDPADGDEIFIELIHELNSKMPDLCTGLKHNLNAYKEGINPDHSQVRDLIDEIEKIIREIGEAIERITGPEGLNNS